MVDLIWDMLHAFRGTHDFNRNPVLSLPNNVEIFCSCQEWQGQDMIFIQGRIAGYPNTAIVVGMTPVMDKGD